MTTYQFQSYIHFVIEWENTLSGQIGKSEHFGMTSLNWIFFLYGLLKSAVKRDGK